MTEDTKSLSGRREMPNSHFFMRINGRNSNFVGGEGRISAQNFRIHCLK